MPKVSRVGKFRKTASLAAKAAPLTPSLAPTPPAAVEAVAAATAAAITTKDHDDALGTTSSTASPTNGKDDSQKSATGDSSSLPKKPQQQQEQQPLSRGQRKRTAKREQYLKREQLVLSSLELKRQEDQKKRIDGLDAMKSALLDTIHLHAAAKSDTTATTTTTAIIKTNKSRQRLVGKEVAQMALVLQHPSFQADPFATIRQHLKNTIPQQASAAVAAIDDRKAKRDEKRAIKKMNESVKRKHNKKRARPTRSKAR